MENNENAKPGKGNEGNLGRIRKAIYDLRNLAPLTNNTQRSGYFLIWGARKSLNIRIILFLQTFHKMPEGFMKM